MKLVMEALFGREKSLQSATKPRGPGGVRKPCRSSIDLFFPFFSSCWTVDKIKIKTHYFMTYQA